MNADTAIRPDAERFLNTLAPDGAFTFGTFTDAKPKPARDSLARVIHGDYGQRAQTLASLNARGAGVFVMVNRGDGKGRKTGNVQAVRALFLDLDGTPLAPVLAAPIAPAIVCESSPGKHHAYWPIADLPLADFTAAQRALAAQYGGDPSVSDLPRIMRLPGYLHAKGEPFTSRLIHCDPVKPWLWPSFAETMGLPFTKPRAEANAGPWHEGERNPALFRFAFGLRGQGLEQAEASKRLQVANSGRCVPPLDATEVASIIASAWKGEVRGFVKLPHTLLDSEAFRNLPLTGKTAILALARTYNGANNGRLALTRTQAKAQGLNRYQRTDALDACESAGLIECTARGMPASPGRRRLPDMFRLLFTP